MDKGDTVRIDSLLEVEIDKVSRDRTSNTLQQSSFNIHITLTATLNSSSLS